MNLEDLILPAPPRFTGSDILIPSFFHCNHPYTKWMLNMLRGGASFRISTMIKERPELFRQIYQIPDCPDIVRNESHDTISMFNRHTILFLNPLCLAIYMKKEKSAELILKSGLNNSNQNCWASEVFSRSQSGRGDLLEIYPICIAIRREYFEVIPILIHCEPRNSAFLVGFKKLDVSERIEIHYENSEGKKVFRYKDALQYAIDTLKRRGNLPLSRLLELFILDCPNLFNPYKLAEDKNGNMFSLFFRIARVAFYNDPDCRICMQLIQCLEILLKHRCVPWNNLLGDLKFPQHFKSPFDKYDEQIILAKDHYSCIGFLLALYNQIQKRVKNGPLDNLGYLIIKALQQTRLIDEFLKMTPEQIQIQFGMISSDIIVPLETTSFVKRHVQAIMELEKEREFKGNIFSRSRSNGFMKRYHRRSCSLVDQSEHSNNQVLLQTRISNSNNTTIPDLMNSQIYPKPLKNHYESIKSEEPVPLYIYQTGINTSETQTASEFPQYPKSLLTANEEIFQSPVHSEICEKIENLNPNQILGLYKNACLKADHKSNEGIGKNACFDNHNKSEPISEDNYLDVCSVKSYRHPFYTEQDERIQILKHQLIPAICKRNYKTRNEFNRQRFENPPLNFGSTSDTDSVRNCLEMTPIRSYPQIVNDTHCHSTDNHRVHSNGDIHTKHGILNSSNNSNNFNNFKPNLLNTTNSKVNPNHTLNYFDELDLMDDLVILGNAEESDLSAELTDNDRLIEYEDDILDELFIEYNELSGSCMNDSVIYPRSKLKPIGDVPFIRKRDNSKYVNNSLYNLSTGDNFSRL